MNQPEAVARELEIAQHAIAVQNKLIHNLETVETTVSGPLMLKSMLLQIVQQANQLTGAEESSIFILDEQGQVIESILARGAVLREQRNTLIGEVLKQGLAGWVMQHQKVGLIEDAETDDRWVNLPGQPYTTRSAMCLPLMKGRQVLGLLTLTHSQPRHFNTLTHKYFARLMPTGLALILSSALLQMKQQPTRQPESQPPTPSPSIESASELEATGIYILLPNYSFQYANPRFLEIFDYELPELVTLESMLDLFARTDQKRVERELEQCFDGQQRWFGFKCKGIEKTGREISLFLEGSLTKLYGKSVIVGALRKL